MLGSEFQVTTSMLRKEFDEFRLFFHVKGYTKNIMVRAN